MKKKILRTIVLSLFILTLVVPVAIAGESEKPNFLFVLSSDEGNIDMAAGAKVFNF